MLRVTSKYIDRRHKRPWQSKMSDLLRKAMSTIWKPSVTVAAIIERNKRFLMVEEETNEGIRINQPAGHLDPNESLEQAVIRETLEETAHDFTPTALIGTYLSRYTLLKPEKTLLIYVLHSREKSGSNMIALWIPAFCDPCG
jgi:8-oxo-dGTP pyrophosphatase MutT (NUDIX family)